MPERYLTLGDELFALLANTFASESFEKKYITLVQVFRQVLNDKLLQHQIAFAGIFPQLQHLIAEYNIPPKAAKLLHITRTRLRKIGSTALNQETLAHDLYAITLLLYYVYPGSVVPASLRALLPKELTSEHLPPLYRDLLRLHVDNFDQEYIWGHDVTSGQALRINLCTEENLWQDFTKYLEVGSQVNVLKAKGNPDNLFPELLIFEPDYLINISSIANSFNAVGVTPYTYLLNKFTPPVASWQILLGNLASELLDLHVHHKVFDIEDELLDFAKRNTLATLTLREHFAEIEAQARLQSSYIATAINTTLQDESQYYNRESLLLEPSFCGQYLGIEGRMDLLQLDKLLLIEQKSGKAAFYTPEDICPKEQLLAHYIQLILYQALLHYAFGISSNKMETYLLYSKYRKPLLRVGSAPQLLYRAIKLRNDIVWQEFQLCSHGFDILTKLSPHDFNTKQTKSTLWTNYTLPDIERTIAPFHSAPTLVLEYFKRFAHSVQRELSYVKIGNAARASYGFASKWLNTFQERLLKGTLIANLTLELKPDEDGRYRKLLFHFQDSPWVTGRINFREGDIVVVYPNLQGRVPDIRENIFFKGRITYFTDRSLVVLLNFSQSSPLAFQTLEGASWIVETDSNETSYNSQFQGLYALLRDDRLRQELILSERHPYVDTSHSLQGDYGEFQQLVLRAKQARELFLVLGPPGTGKTSYVLMNILREELQDSEHNVLLAAFTNRAVNEICSKLVRSDIDFVYLGSRLSAAPEYYPYLLEERIKACTNLEEMATELATCRVFCANTTLLSSQLQLFSLKKFSLAIIDEASQLLEPQLLPLLCAGGMGRNPIERFVLIGDHKQLPAVSQQTDTEGEIREDALRTRGITNCKNSFFERMFRVFRNDPSVTYFLTKHARMHEEIAAFVNYNFYQGRLQIKGLPHQVEKRVFKNADISHRLAFLAAQRILFLSYPRTIPLGGSVENINDVEATLIAQLVQDFIDYYAALSLPFVPERDLGIIVPYRIQIAQIRNALLARGIEAGKEMTIDTVERFQGSERRVIIYGFTAQTPFQLNFLTDSCMEEEGSIIDRKLNVAISRAREHIVLVGSASLLAENITYYKLLCYLKARGAFYELLPEEFLTPEWKPIAKKSHTHSQTSYICLDPHFYKTYEYEVLRPVQNAKRAHRGKALNTIPSEFAENILGYGFSVMEKNIELVFGESTTILLTPEDQALLWAYHFLPSYYKGIREQFLKDWGRCSHFLTKSQSILFFEIGNSFAGFLSFLSLKPIPTHQICYYNFAPSKALQQLGEKLIDTTYPRLKECKWLSTIDDFDTILSCTPASLVVLQFSHAFLNYTPSQAKELAGTLMSAIKNHSEHSYYCIFSTAEFEESLRSYQAFFAIFQKLG